jgi:acetyl esterase
MTEKHPAEPLYELIGRIRHPVSLRELMAACLRSIYMGDPFTNADEALPALPQILYEEVSVTEVVAAGVRCVIYSPKKTIGTSPLMLYMHGGGFVIGCSEDTDYITRMLCHSNRMVVVSINYRLAPETIFPGAVEDCVQAFEFALGGSSQLGIDPNWLYLGGDSAGANLAIALAQRLRPQYKSSIKGIVLLAPWLDMEVEKYDSYNRLAPRGVVFDAAFIGYARAAYVGFEQWKNPLVSPLFCSLTDLPPTIALIGTEDPFLDQVLELKKQAVQSAWKQLVIEVYQDMPHCFYSFPNLFSAEQACYNRISEFVQRTSK